MIIKSKVTRKGALLFYVKRMVYNFCKSGCGENGLKRARPYQWAADRARRQQDWAADPESFIEL
jgi:hypothetical protein